MKTYFCCLSNIPYHPDHHPNPLITNIDSTRTTPQIQKQQHKFNNRTCNKKKGKVRVDRDAWGVWISTRTSTLVDRVQWTRMGCTVMDKEGSRAKGWG